MCVWGGGIAREFTGGSGRGFSPLPDGKVLRSLQHLWIVLDFLPLPPDVMWESPRVLLCARHTHIKMNYGKLPPLQLVTIHVFFSAFFCQATKTGDYTSSGKKRIPASHISIPMFCSARYRAGPHPGGTPGFRPWPKHGPGNNFVEKKMAWKTLSVLFDGYHQSQGGVSATRFPPGLH